LYGQRKVYFIFKYGLFYFSRKIKWLWKKIVVNKNTKISSKGKTQRIEIRIDSDLRSYLGAYCEKNLQTSAEVVTLAIKEFIGFGQSKPTKRKIEEIDSGNKKSERLEIRMHLRLKQDLVDFCLANEIENVSLGITEAIKNYIKFERK